LKIYDRIQDTIEYDDFAKLTHLGGDLNVGKYLLFVCLGSSTYIA
jgi:hypothetical protein